MFDHVTIRVADHKAALAFCETVLRELELEQTSAPGATFVRWGELSVVAHSPENPPARGLHIGFIAPSREHVDRFWAAGIAAGYTDDGAPGPRSYTDDYYGAFLLDPDGNSAEAGHYTGMRTAGVIDHLWLRVADVDAADAFYATIAPVLGLEVARLTPDHVIVRGPDGASFSMVAGTALTEHVHIALKAGDHATVDAFHATATAGGYRDNGAPGHRPQYSPDYYGAFILDPAGHNIEAVARGGATVP